MRTQLRNVGRAALRPALMMGIAICASMTPQSIAFAQAGPAFEMSPAAAATRGLGPSRMTMSRTPQRIAFESAQVGNLMAFAYGLPLDRIERRPQWMYDDAYDVAVTMAAPASLPEQKLLLQKLLEERFGLMVHRISTPSTVYFLVPGSKVTLSESKNDAEDISQFLCTRNGPQSGSASSGLPGETCATRHASMSDLADWLYPRVGLPVLDKTGITGYFDIELPGLPARISAEGTIQALRNALGLDLEVHRGTADSLIIDHAERPIRN